MQRLWQSIGKQAVRLATSWGSFAAFATFLIYLFGYLSLRFHLTAFGIDAELNVLDERYLFAGARFLVYLLATVPTIVLFGLVLLAVLALLALPLWLVRFAFRPLFGGQRWQMLAARLRGWWAALVSWWLRPGVLVFIGLVISVLMIQLVMRQCFVFGNLLLADMLPGPQWLQRLLLTSNDLVRSVYFAGLVAGIFIVAAFLLGTARVPLAQTRDQMLTALLGLLLAIQVLLLPINHGILIAGHVAPKVEIHGENGKQLISADIEAWIIWEGKDTLTLLTRNKQAVANAWRIVTIRRKDIERVEAYRFDAVLQLVHTHLLAL